MFGENLNNQLNSRVFAYVFELYSACLLGLDKKIASRQFPPFPSKKPNFPTPIFFPSPPNHIQQTPKKLIKHSSPNPQRQISSKHQNYPALITTSLWRKTTHSLTFKACLIP